MGKVYKLDKQAFNCYNGYKIRRRRAPQGSKLIISFFVPTRFRGRKKISKEVDMAKHVDYNELTAFEAVTVVAVAVLAVANGVLFALNVGVA